MRQIRYISLILLLGTFTAVNAQSGLGIKAGAGNGNIRLQYDSFKDFISGNQITGMEAGLFYRLDMNGIYLQPEALYLFRTGTVNNDNNAHITLHRIQFPVMVGLHLLGPLSVEGGPTYNRIFAVDHDLNNNLSIRKDGVGYKVGPALRIHRLMLYAHYEGLVLSPGSGAKLSEPNRLTFGIGWMLGRHSSK
ncbi:MAG: outer membrane beta-barrel protein [Flavobacteriales bacterium]|nr:outer membrane beta-barrel protein [Flavobacteriales bacterium]MCB9448374.1 outer membrane beta-barrel protein [Flavobacteriales bacterium]